MVSSPLRPQTLNLLQVRTRALRSLLSLSLFVSLIDPVLFAPGNHMHLELNVTQFLGRWYQMYGDLITQGTFELGAVCVTATYGLFPNGSVSVFNEERGGGDPVHGPPRNISGYATVPDPLQPGKLEVHLDGVPVGAECKYPLNLSSHLQLTLSSSTECVVDWVFLLGPLNENNEYAYAVVSDGLQASLFVLARDVTEFNALYNAEVTSWLASNGWTQWYNKPIATTQIGCAYPPAAQSVL